MILSHPVGIAFVSPSSPPTNRGSCLGLRSRSCLRPRRKIVVVTLGNEVLTCANDSALAHCLVPAMENLHGALTSISLDRDVSVTPSPSYLPSGVVFCPDLLSYVRPLLAFHSRTGTPVGQMA
ncbi:hypothetical protein OPV22_030107 [Ensete ventricosum]|uniref:Uncharacterized protein n=1 Tax=Ensete ventricosum TaxID=4639 RepID=A0AAV8QF61_ENSVE|nr:hypothetical protein OPV22_030107 [Ensete ventricosum]